MSDIFDHEGDAWECGMFGRTANGDGYERKPPRCNRCGSTEVRWRQQGGRWVLFSLQPGKEHVCPVEDEFDALD